MACHRCQGLMIGCVLDKELTGWVWGWRCANCGFLVDPRVERIRKSRPLKALADEEPEPRPLQQPRSAHHRSTSS